MVELFLEIHERHHSSKSRVYFSSEVSLYEVMIHLASLPYVGDKAYSMKYTFPDMTLKLSDPILWIFTREKMVIHLKTVSPIIDKDAAEKHLKAHGEYTRIVERIQELEKEAKILEQQRKDAITRLYDTRQLAFGKTTVSSPHGMPLSTYIRRYLNSKQ